jgi:DNA mismatch repair ATPase MutS
LTSTDSLIAAYNEKIIFFNQEITKEKSKVTAVFYTRLVAFIAAFALFFLFIQHTPAISFLLAVASIILFLILLKIELRTQRKIDFLKNRIRINENEIAILNNQLDQLDPGKEFINKEHPFIADLDIFGNRSIFQLLNRTSTYTGRIKLATWLTFPFLDKKTIVERQQAVKCLSEKLEWSQQFIAKGVDEKENEKDKDIVSGWLKEDALFSSPVLKILAVALPVLTVLALVFQLLNMLDSSYFIFLFFLQLMIVGSQLKKISHIHNQLSRKINTVDKYAALIQLIESEAYNSDKLNELKQLLATHEGTASFTIRKLKKLVDTLDARLNLVVAVALNGIFLFDINMMQRIEKWKAQHKTDFLNWIDVIGEFDAFISLGINAHNNPDYAYADVETDQFIIQAENTGHPLINKTKLVTNNYTINGLSKIDLLTGANMAGKSTFLRTIGVNLTLAMIGLPVCASKFRFTPILLFTSLRTNDSLQENESFFYAELKRLQLLMHQYEQGQRVFFLLDEILKGTNSKDQHAGSEALIKKIIHLKGVGIVATHDVELSKLVNELPDHIRNLCFEITISGDKLSFDYTLKAGVCATMNASFLMQRMGIT